MRFNYLWLSFFLFSFHALAVDPVWQEGQHYNLIEPSQPTHASEGKVEVLEVFSYACPHCYSFDPFLENWEKTGHKNGELARLPAIFNRSYELMARGFYTAEVLGIKDKLHTPIFEAMHGKDRSKLIRTPEQMAELFEANGVDRKTFDSTFNSFAVDTKIRRAQTIAPRYGIESVPTIIVAGKYRTGGKEAGNYDNLLKIIDHLVELESKAPPPAKTVTED